MKLSRKWLSEFVDVKASSKEFAEAMTMSGSKVEITEEPFVSGVVIGRILELKHHPNADKLSVCSVDIGSESLTIVTGASNLTVGDLVPVALVGATLAGGVKIEPTQLRGVDSFGMLCSLKELGLTVADFPYAIENGIFVVKEACKPGDDAVALLGLDDSVVEFEITNNRPDCLNVIGLAREAAATFGKELRLREPKVTGSGGDINELLKIEVADPDLCPRYTARLVKNVKIAPSPKWMRERLRSSGLRPINNIVDITNYVMLEYGQPMHAFDYSCVKGGRIVVRRAGSDREYTTLDGNVRRLLPDMLMIADEKLPIGIAGVMGGESSEITENTKTIVFESALFNGPSIRNTAVALGMRTDASSRFEKGLDFENTLPAVQRACELVEMLGAGEVVDGIIDIAAEKPEIMPVELNPDKINRLLGLNVSREDMIAMLSSLGFKLEGDMVIAPSWRSDVECSADLAEEVARLYGYDKIPITMFKAETAQGQLSQAQSMERLTGTLCRGLGYTEILTYSFVSPKNADKIRLPADSPLRNAVRILNPLGEDTSVMRTSSLPSMLEVLARNSSYRNKDVRFYELGKVYLPVEGEALPYEPTYLTFGFYGSGDFFRLKGEIEALFKALNIKTPEFATDSSNPSYHPGRCAKVSVEGREIGVIGQIHPLVASNYDIAVEVYAAQLNFTDMLESLNTERTYTPLPKYPAVSRDIALVCDEGISSAVLVDCIKRGGGALLREASLFDVFRGGNLQKGKKSAAYSLSFRADERTLTDAEADALVKTILEQVKADLGAVLR